MTRHRLTATLTALNREWASLCDEHPRTPSGWRLACGPHLPDKGLEQLLAAISAEPDATLLGLLTLHRAGDPLAGRVVVQAMLGKLVLMAVRDADATLPDYLAAMWERVASYPVSRRPHRVAANLVLDTLKSVKSNRRQQLLELPGMPPEAPAAPCDETAEALDDADQVLAAGVRLGVITEATRTTLRCVYVDGRTSVAAAEILGATPAAIRQRCSQGVRALRAAAPDLVEQLAG